MTPTDQPRFRCRWGWGRARARGPIYQDVNLWRVGVALAPIVIYQVAEHATSSGLLTALFVGVVAEAGLLAALSFPLREHYRKADRGNIPPQYWPEMARSTGRFAGSLSAEQEWVFNQTLVRDVQECQDLAELTGRTLARLAGFTVATSWETAPLIAALRKFQTLCGVVPPELPNLPDDEFQRTLDLLGQYGQAPRRTKPRPLPEVVRDCLAQCVQRQEHTAARWSAWSTACAACQQTVPLKELHPCIGCGLIACTTCLRCHRVKYETCLSLAADGSGQPSGAYVTPWDLMTPDQKRAFRGEMGLARAGLLAGNPWAGRDLADLNRLQQRLQGKDRPAGTGGSNLVYLAEHALRLCAACESSLPTLVKKLFPWYSGDKVIEVAPLTVEERDRWLAKPDGFLPWKPR